MPATVTLTQGTLTYGISSGDEEVVLSTVTGIDRGTRIFIDSELMSAKAAPNGLRVKVLRGVDGTPAAPHSSSAVCTIGRADQFYTEDPKGRPDNVIPVSPYINVVNGSIWFAQGDSLPDSSLRWWQEMTTEYQIGAFGVRFSESAPSSST